MGDQRVGRAIRELRRRRGWRQIDLAAAAGVGQSLISLVERGHLTRVTLGTLRVVAGALDAEFLVEMRWRGGALDRVLDERHARLVGFVVSELRRLGWRVEIEVSFSHYGERGSIDVLALHPQTGALVVIEVKSELTSIEELLRRVDVKVRLAPAIAKDRFGQVPRSVSRLIVVERSATTYRHVERHGSVLGSALPDRGHAVRQWLRDPARALAGLWVVSSSTPRSGIRRHAPPVRVRVPRNAVMRSRESRSDWWMRQGAAGGVDTIAMVARCDKTAPPGPRRPVGPRRASLRLRYGGPICCCRSRQRLLADLDEPFARPVEVEHEREHCRHRNDQDNCTERAASAGQARAIADHRHRQVAPRIRSQITVSGTRAVEPAVIRAALRSITSLSDSM